MGAEYHILQNRLHQIEEVSNILDGAIEHFNDSKAGDEAAAGWLAECARDVVDLVKSFAR